MRKKCKLSPAEFAIIEDFLIDKVEHCNTALAKLQSVPKTIRPDYFDNAIVYWKHARGALNWALGNARQMAGVK